MEWNAGIEPISPSSNGRGQHNKQRVTSQWFPLNQQRSQIMQVAVYVRVSTQRQVQSQSIEQQLERLRNHIEQKGWVLSDEHIFRDDGYSGSTLKRPGLDRLRDCVSTAAFDRILVTAPDRLARKDVHQVLVIEELERKGAQVEFVDRPMSQDPHDQLVLQIRGAVAEYERSLIVDRMRRGRLLKYQQGILLPWTRPPYGYRLHPERPRHPRGPPPPPRRCPPGAGRSSHRGRTLCDLSARWHRSHQIGQTLI